MTIASAEQVCVPKQQCIFTQLLLHDLEHASLQKNSEFRIEAEDA